MSINEAMRSALRTLSYSEKDMTETYQKVREVKTRAGRRVVKNPYRMFDHEICREDHVVPVRLYAPNASFSAPGLLLFFHGGGWVVGNIDSYDRVCSNMAKVTGQLVLSVDYRLAPEHKFPCGVEDCYEVARQLFCNTAMLPGIGPESITLIGDSAGGNLAAAVSLMARDRGAFAVKRQILLYPATAGDHSDTASYPSLRTNGTDFLLTTRRVQEYLSLYQRDASDEKNPYFAPLMAQDFSRQPDTLLITAEFDPLRDEGEAYGEALRAAGNRVQILRMANALHGFLSLPPHFAHVRHTYEKINQFLGGDCL